MIIKIKRGTTAGLSTLKLKRGELAYDKTTKNLYVGMSDDTTEKVLLTNNKNHISESVYVSNYLPRKHYSQYTEYQVGDVCPLYDGKIPLEFMPASIGSEIRYYNSTAAIPTPYKQGVLYATYAENKLYHSSNGTNLIELHNWNTHIFDGGTF
jgi:hypothetical protein